MRKKVRSKKLVFWCLTYLLSRTLVIHENGGEDVITLKKEICKLNETIEDLKQISTSYNSHLQETFNYPLSGKKRKLFDDVNMNKIMNVFEYAAATLEPLKQDYGDNIKEKISSLKKSLFPVTKTQKAKNQKLQSSYESLFQCCSKYNIYNGKSNNISLAISKLIASYESITENFNNISKKSTFLQKFGEFAVFWIENIHIKRSNINTAIKYSFFQSLKNNTTIKPTVLCQELNIQERSLYRYLRGRDIIHNQKKSPISKSTPEEEISYQTRSSSNINLTFLDQSESYAINRLSTSFDAPPDGSTASLCYSNLNDDDDMDEFVDCDLDDLIYLLTQLVEPKITVPELKDLCSKWGIKPGSKVKKTLFTE